MARLGHLLDIDHRDTEKWGHLRPPGFRPLRGLRLFAARREPVSRNPSSVGLGGRRGGRSEGD